MSAVSARLSAALQALTASHVLEASALEHFEKERVELDSQETELRREVVKTEEKSRWFGEFKDEVEDWSAFLDEKVKVTIDRNLSEPVSDCPDSYSSRNSSASRRLCSPFSENGPRSSLDDDSPTTRTMSPCSQERVFRLYFDLQRWRTEMPRCKENVVLPFRRRRTCRRVRSCGRLDGPNENDGSASGLDPAAATDSATTPTQSCRRGTAPTSSRRSRRPNRTSPRSSQTSKLPSSATRTWSSGGGSKSGGASMEKSTE